MQVNLRAEGIRNAAKLKGEGLETTSRTARRIREVWQKINVMVTYTHDEAQSLFTETNLTKNQYKKVRTQVKHKTLDTYSNYHKLRAAKEERYPYKEANVIADCAAETKLQALLE